MFTDAGRLLLVAWLGTMLHWLEALFAGHGYLLVALLVGGESMGLPLPGETSLLAASVVARNGHLVLPIVMVTAAGAAIIGDNLGYLVGHFAGRPLLLKYGRLFRIREREVTVIDYYFCRHGGKTVFFGRWITVVRAAAALVAGASGMPWGRFFLFNALGGVAWAVTMSGLGYLFAASIAHVKSGLGIFGVVAFVVVVGGGFVFLRRTEHRLFSPFDERVLDDQTKRCRRQALEDPRVGSGQASASPPAATVHVRASDEHEQEHGAVAGDGERL